MAPFLHPRLDFSARHGGNDRLREKKSDVFVFCALCRLSRRLLNGFLLVLRGFETMGRDLLATP